MFIQQFYVNGIAHTSYLLGGRRACAIVDPKRDVDDYLAAAKTMGYTITHILETHLHADFISGHMDLAAKTGAPIVAPASGECAYDHHAVADGDRLQIDNLDIEVLDTPGHTPDCICFVVTDRSRGKEPTCVFTGDTLFVGDVGRPDLFPGRGDELAGQLYDHLHGRLMTLPDFCEVYPAHGAGSLCGRAMGAKRWSTIGYERRFNAALQHGSRDEFKGALLTAMPEAPDHFSRCSAVNRAGPALTADRPPPAPLSPAAVRDLAGKDHLVVDGRDYRSFGGAHVPGAWNIDRFHNFATFGGWLLPPDRPIILVAQSDEDIADMTVQLRRVGLDQVVGYLEGGMGTWVNAGLPVEHIAQMSVHDLRQLCDAGGDFTILDVRARSEWDAARIDGAVHVPLPDTRTKHAEVPAGGTVALLCKSGARAGSAGSILQQHGAKNLAVVAGGMTAWVAAGYGPECPTCSLTHGPRVQE